MMMTKELPKTTLNEETETEFYNKTEKQLQKERDPVKVEIVRRIQKDQDAIMVAAGARGSTKSGSFISLFDQLDRDSLGRPRFTLPYELFPPSFRLLEGERMPRVVWRPKDFMKLISMSDRLPKMSGIIWDETGVEGDAREALTLKNRLIKKTMETIRSRNLLIGLTSPSVKSFDSSLRRLMTHYFEMSGAIQLSGEKQKSHGRCKVYLIEIDGFSGEVYKKYIIYKNPGDGQLKRLDTYYYIKKPDQALEVPYKRMKNFVQTEWYSDYEKQLQELHEAVQYVDDQEKAGKDLKSLKKRFMESPQDFYDYVEKKFILGAMVDKMEITYAKARELKNYLQYLVDEGELNV